MRPALIALVAAAVLGIGTVAVVALRDEDAAPRVPVREFDWPLFGLNPSRTNATNLPTGIDASNAGRLRRRVVALPGTVDSSPIYLHDVRVRGARRDIFVMTTTYGRTLALEATTGRILWVFTPRSYASYAGTYQITVSAPAADPDRTHVFATSPDGMVHRLALSSGREVTTGAWPVAVTKLPEREKLTGAINVTSNHVIVATGGYVGDQPPYQGHVVVLERRSGRILGVFNTLCANVHRVMDPRECPSSHGAVWARAGVLVEPSGRLLFATGRGHADERTDFGNSVLELTATARRLVQHWTPQDANERDVQDVDVGSAAPALTGRGTVVQSGKDGRLHVLLLRRLAREVQTLPAPGDAAMIAGYPAVWRHGTQVTLFATTAGGTAAYRVEASGRLTRLWANSTPGTSPVVAGGLLYVYDPGGALLVYEPFSGDVVARLPAAPGHWNAPVITPGRVALPTGDANEHETTGELSLFTLP